MGVRAKDLRRTELLPRLEFVDFEKAFDRVNWIKMLGTLKKIGVDWKDRRLIAELHLNQEL